MLPYNCIFFTVLQIHYSFHMALLRIYRYVWFVILSMWASAFLFRTLLYPTFMTSIQQQNGVQVCLVVLWLCWYYYFLLYICIGILCYWGLDLYHSVRNRMIIMRNHPHYIQVYFSCAFCINLSIISSFYLCRNFHLHSGLAAVKNRIVNICISFLFTNI